MNHTTAATVETAVAPRGRRAPSVRACGGLLFLVAALLLAVEHLRPSLLRAGAATPEAALAAAAAASAIALALLWRARRWATRVLTSIPFSVALLSALLGATVLGTVVVQRAPAAEYEARYGPVLGPLLVALGLDDPFHTLWFRGWLALLATSLLLVAATRPIWRPALWGTALCHLGVVVVLVGGALGAATGFRGYVDLHEGGSAVAAHALDGGEARALGFALRLDDFELEERPAQYRLRLYARDGDEWRLTRSLSEEDAGRWAPASEGSELRLVAVHPDFRMRRELRAAPDGTGIPALSVELDGEVLALLAGVPGRDALDLPDGTRLGVAERAPSDGELARLTEPRDAVHAVRYHLEDGSEGEVRLRPGESRELAGGLRLSALRWIPDFTYDVERREATTRSERPQNPALLVALEGRGAGPAPPRWLFAKMPDFGESHGEGAGPRLLYRYEPGYAPPARELLIVADTEDVWEIAGGGFERTLTLDELRGDEVLGGARLELLASAHEIEVAESASDEWRRPAAELEVRGAAAGPYGVRRVILAAGSSEPLFLGAEAAAVFERRVREVKAYRSRVTVVEDGSPVAARTIEVNHPLAWGGWHVYQSSYRREDPTYSGFLVVRDPGYGVAFAGFAMLGVGVFLHAYLRPRRPRRRPS